MNKTINNIEGSLPKFATDMLKLFQQTMMAWFEDNASRQAAALAYYGVLSLAPLLIIAISVAGILFGRTEIQQQVINEVSQTMGAGTADLVESVLNATYNSDGGIFATILSLLLLLFAATNLFSQLKTSLNRIWNVEHEDQSLVKGVLMTLQARLMAAVMVVGFGLLLILSQIFSTAVSLVIAAAGNLPFNTSLLLQVLNIVVSIGMSTLIFSLIFRFLPDKRLAWGDIWVGALFTALLFAFGQRAISIYLENSTVASAYGVAGSVIVLLLWIYYSASILLFGAEFTQAYSHLFGSQQEEAGRTPEANLHSV